MDLGRDRMGGLQLLLIECDEALEHVATEKFDVGRIDFLCY